MQVEEHAVVESHPANEMADLRLDRPFPGLVRYMDAMDLDSMDKQARRFLLFMLKTGGYFFTHFI